MKRKVLNLVERTAPRFTARERYKRAQKRLFEREQIFLPLLCSPDKVSIDVGAADGAYVFRLVECSSSVIAIEPREATARRLDATSRLLKLPVEVLNIALSSTPGKHAFRCVGGDEGRSTMEAANALGDVDSALVTESLIETLTLDQMAVQNVGFIKIDVEGHELAVLTGGKGTIQQYSPNLMLELEDRHSPGSLAGCQSFLSELGYAGFFLDRWRLRPFEEFDPAVFQDPRNIGVSDLQDETAQRYVNNFIFIPKTEVEGFLPRANEVAQASGH